MVALRTRSEDFVFEVYTLVDETFFDESVGRGFDFHAVETDLGLVQDTPLEENVPATILRLDEQLPYDDRFVTSLAAEINAVDCVAVVCDIAPLGICVAREAGVPSILVENFRWDWIYEGYLDAHPGIGQAIEYMREIFKLADFHIQTAPISEPVKCDFTSGAVSRKPVHTRQETRAALGIGSEACVVLVSGGVPPNGMLMERLAAVEGIHIVVSGFGDEIVTRNSLTSLPYQSGYYHPDLVTASDAVVGKLGYSTVSEVYRAGVPYAYIPRARFRESPSLEAFVQGEMPCRRIEPETYPDGDWLEMLPELVSLPATVRNSPNGADQVAEFMHTRILG